MGIKSPTAGNRHRLFHPYPFLDVVETQPLSISPCSARPADRHRKRRGSPRCPVLPWHPLRVARRRSGRLSHDRPSTGPSPRRRPSPGTGARGSSGSGFRRGTAQRTGTEKTMATFTVSTSDQLKDALQSARGGDKILLEAGDYGHLEMRGTQDPRFVYSGEVTVASADPDNPAVLKSMLLRRREEPDLRRSEVRSGDHRLDRHGGKLIQGRRVERHQVQEHDVRR